MAQSKAARAWNPRVLQRSWYTDKADGAVQRVSASARRSSTRLLVHSQRCP